MQEQTKVEGWTAATIAVIQSLRTWAIRKDTSALKAWETVSERARLAGRRAETVKEWISIIMRELRIGVVDKATSAQFIELAGAVGDDVDEWFDWVRSEHEFLFALAREQVDRKKEERALASGQGGESSPKPRKSGSTKRSKAKGGAHV